MCKGNMTYNQTYDCECLAAEVMRVREASDAPISDSLIIFREGKKCPNLVQMAGHRYTSCMISSLPVTYDLLPQPFCECSVREWTKLMDQNKGRFKIGSDEVDSLFLNAQKTCMTRGAGATK